VFEERIATKMKISPSLEQAEESGLPPTGIPDEIGDSGKDLS